MRKDVFQQLQIADSRMRELFGFYWHRRNSGISRQRLDQLTREIKAGEKIIERAAKEVK